MRKFKWVVMLVVVVAMGRATSFLAGVPMPTYLGGTRTPVPSENARTARGRALAKATVFMPNPPDLRKVDLARHSADEKPFAPNTPLDCRFVPEPVSGTTPKFDCELADGEVVKVKYGRTPERPAEVGATRLLSALGFGADRVSVVRTLRCHGCPPTPFRMRQVAESVWLGRFFERTLDYTTTRTFTNVTVERKFPGTAIKAESIEGWDFTELKWIDPGVGGATRADVDALRLVAVLLAHWDNKAVNQRLVCLDDIPKEQSTSCAHPLVMLQDVGATFGPSKANLEHWAESPVWEDEASCRIGMTALPYHGATFQPVEISEGGRLRLAELLRQLTRDQLNRLFTYAGFPPSRDGSRSWASVLEKKIRAIVDRAPCPLAG